MIEAFRSRLSADFVLFWWTYQVRGLCIFQALRIHTMSNRVCTLGITPRVPTLATLSQVTLSTDQQPNSTVRIDLFYLFVRCLMLYSRIFHLCISSRHCIWRKQGSAW